MNSVKTCRKGIKKLIKFFFCLRVVRLNCTINKMDHNVFHRSKISQLIEKIYLVCHIIGSSSIPLISLNFISKHVCWNHRFNATIFSLVVSLSSWIQKTDRNSVKEFADSFLPKSEKSKNSTRKFDMLISILGANLSFYDLHPGRFRGIQQLSICMYVRKTNHFSMVLKS